VKRLFMILLNEPLAAPAVLSAIAAADVAGARWYALAATITAVLARFVVDGPVTKAGTP
jgi:hypothetical protein